jgi:hypothetical protein
MSGEVGTITKARKNTRPVASPTEALAHRIKMIITMNTCQERSGKSDAAPDRHANPRCGGDVELGLVRRRLGENRRVQFFFRG